LRLEICPDLRAQSALLIERPARGNAHQEERQRYDDEKRRYGGQKPPQDIKQHEYAPFPVG
jgi:hypothetical protein